MAETKSKFIDKFIDPKFILSLVLAFIVLIGFFIDMAVDKALMKNDFIALKQEIKDLKDRTGTLPEDIQDIHKGIGDVKFYLEYIAKKAKIELPIPPGHN
jgi:cell division protein FtsB